MKQPQISVIVPVYKAEAYLHRCIDSLLAQTFSDFELLLIDDGSPDLSGRICDEYAAQDTRIKVIHKQNGGVGSARQCGLDNATGEYTIHTDPDDCVEPNMLEALYQKAVSENADIVICDYWITYSNNNQVYRHQNVEGLNALEISEKIATGAIHGSLWNKLIRNSLYQNPRITFTPGINMWEDMLICIKLLTKKPKVTYLNKAFVHYQQHDKSLTQSLSKPSLEAMVQVVKEIEPYLSKQAISYLQLTVKKEWLYNSTDTTILYQCCDMYSEADKYIGSHPTLPIHHKLILKFAQKKHIFIIKCIRKTIKTIQRIYHLKYFNYQNSNKLQNK